MRLFVFSSLLALLLAGCGSGSGSGRDERLVPPTAPVTSLQITVWPQGLGTGEPLEYSLSCFPAAGTHPDPDFDPVAACAALEAAGSAAFAATPPNTACTELYGGPQVAEVSGTVAGSRVDTTLERTNGCAIARWEALKTVVPIPVWNPAP
ncbi:MAG: SSI family serine proteinase inhibitor [Gaiellaceae bacterium]